jgi:hypothetical protein
MKMKLLLQMMVLGLASAVTASAGAGVQGASDMLLPASGVETPKPEAATPPVRGVAKPPAPAPDTPEASKPATADTQLNDADRKKKPVPKPVAVEPLTPEQATHKAADPKAPTGALIVKPPEDLPAPAAGSPATPAAPASK